MIYVDNMPNPQMTENKVAYFFILFFCHIKDVRTNKIKKRKEVKNEILCYGNGRRSHVIF